MNKENKNKINRKIFNIAGIIFVFAFCLMLLPFEQLSFIEGQAFADSNDMIDYTISLDDYKETPETKNDINKTLWQMSITPAIDEKDQKQKDELLSLIDQLNSIELSFTDVNYETESVNTSETITQPEQTLPKEDNTQSIYKNENTDKNILEYVTEQTIEKLKKLAEKPDEVDNPYEIGNTLYLSNNIGEAAVFYQEALKRKKPEDMSSSEDRAWLLFQTGNSLRTRDMLAAADIYGKLITEYPNSPWTDYARVQRNVITWYLSDKPDELLKQINK